MADYGLESGMWFQSYWVTKAVSGNRNVKYNDVSDAMRVLRLPGSLSRNGTMSVRGAIWQQLCGRLGGARLPRQPVEGAIATHKCP
jgi:hypothetical protein